MEVIVFESEAYLKLRAEILEEVRSFLSAFLIKQNGSADKVWLSPEEARQLIGLKSRRSMKLLRESGDVHYAKIGREFRYDKKASKSIFLINPQRDIRLSLKRKNIKKTIFPKYIGVKIKMPVRFSISNQ